MRLAAIDFGTNSLRILIADTARQHNAIILNPVARNATITQLGETLHSDKVISQQAVERCLTVIDEYIRLISSHKVNKTYAVATSVFRDARNGATVKKCFEEHLGIPITILSGTREAELMFKGIMCNRSAEPDKNYVCVDIGGGSCEFIIAYGNTVLHSTSIQSGCLRSKNQFLKSNPPTYAQLVAMQEEVRDQLAGFIKNCPERIDSFFAFGGTITSLSMIVHQILTAADTENTVLKKSDILHFIEAIESKTDEEIGLLYAHYLDRGRETVLRTGVLIFLTIMDIFQQEAVIVTNQGILSGVLGEQFTAMQTM